MKPTNLRHLAKSLFALLLIAATMPAKAQTTRLFVEGSAKIDGKLDIATPSTNNIFIGRNAGLNNTTGSKNIALGMAALGRNTDRSELVAIGDSALYNNGLGATEPYDATANTAVGAKALFSNTIGFSNTANGVSALFSNTTGSYNTASGYQALSSNTTGYANTASGYGALFSNTEGGGNTANGIGSLFSNTTGFSNTASGNYALNSNTTGFENTANGKAALHFNTEGNNNTANGSQALYLNTTGYYNTASGVSALYSNTEGFSNMANGYCALFNNTEGHNNTANGSCALSANTTGSNNTGLGRNADVSAGNFTNATAIGYDAIVNASNKMQLGNNTTGTIHTSGGYTIASDGRFKNNIKENMNGLEFIMALKPVSYNFDYKKYDDFVHQNHKEYAQLKDDGYQQKLAERGKKREVGFIAQEVEQTVQKLGIDFNGVYAPQNETDNYGIDYSKFVVPLVKAVQEQNQTISAQNQTIKEQEALNNVQNQTIKEQKTEIEDLKTRLEKLEALLLQNNPQQTSTLQGSGAARLEQNTPNPFKNETTITYYLPKSADKADLRVTTSHGQLIRSINISAQQGTHQVNLSTNELPKGVYFYTLYIDGKLIDTKQMVFQ